MQTVFYSLNVQIRILKSEKVKERFEKKVQKTSDEEDKQTKKINLDLRENESKLYFLCKIYMKGDFLARVKIDRAWQKKRKKTVKQKRWEFQIKCLEFGQKKEIREMDRLEELDEDEETKYE